MFSSFKLGCIFLHVSVLFPLLAVSQKHGFEGCSIRNACFWLWGIQDTLQKRAHKPTHASYIFKSLGWGMLGYIRPLLDHLGLSRGISGPLLRSQINPLSPLIAPRCLQDSFGYSHLDPPAPKIAQQSLSTLAPHPEAEQRPAHGLQSARTPLFIPRLRV